MFDGRVTFDRDMSLIKFLVCTGWSEQALLAAADNEDIEQNRETVQPDGWLHSSSFPRAQIKKEENLQYFRFYGRDVHALRA